MIEEEDVAAKDDERETTVNPAATADAVAAAAAIPGAMRIISVMQALAFKLRVQMYVTMLLPPVMP